MVQRRGYVAATTRKGRPKKTYKRRRINPFLILWLLLAAVILLCFGLWVGKYYKPTLAAGITINGVKVGGMTREEAKAAVGVQQDAALGNLILTVAYDDASWQRTGTDLGVGSNIDEILDEAGQLARTGSFSQRRREAAQIRREGADYTTCIKADESALQAFLAEIQANVDIQPQNAVVEFTPEAEQRFTINPERPGRVTDLAASAEAVQAALKGGASNKAELVVQLIEPTYTKEFLETCTQTRGYFETEVKGTDNRVSNVALALKQFNGMVVWPGEEVSFNDTTGERSEENGYKKAAVIAQDKGLEDDLGGGVCQSSTTLYNAMLKAGLQITERHRHSFPSSYVRTGFDAMVNYPSADFKFVNNSDGPIFIATSVYNGVAAVTVYGRSLGEGVTIDRESREVYRSEMPEYERRVDAQGQYVQYVDEEYTKVYSRQGIQVETYRIWKKDGQVTQEEKLYTDDYPAITGVIYVGAKERPADPTPTPAPTGGVPTPDPNAGGE